MSTKNKVLESKSLKSKLGARNSQKEALKERRLYTSEIAFSGVGTSKNEGKFLKVMRGSDSVVLSTRNLRRQPKDELQRLEELNIELILPAAQNEFLKRAQDAANQEPSFEVATQIGWMDGVFVLPRGVSHLELSKVEIHLSDRHADVHSRLRCAGSLKDMNRLFDLCRGNPRLIFVQALSFVGPICEPFRFRAPGFQFVGEPGSGKTTAGIIAGANWGGDPDSSLGFGSSWNGTPNGLEEYGPAHHHTFMFLDETATLPTDDKGRTISFGEALMRLSQGQGKKRLTELLRALWSSTLFSASNSSVYSMLEPARRIHYEAYVDRLVDIPVATGRGSFFEDLHGFPDEHHFGIHLFNVATSNYGFTSRIFIKKLGSELASGRGKLVAFVRTCIADYNRRAASISSPKRNVMRVGGHFATVYAAGRLAIRYGILPFGEAELLEAILTCHRDHVALIDRESEIGFVQPVSAASPAVATRPAEKPVDRVMKFVNDNRRNGFVDVNTAGARAPNHPAPQGFKKVAKGFTEYWLPEEVFQRVAGGVAEARAAKLELARRKLVRTGRRDKKITYLFKRTVPGSTRPYFVVLVHQHRSSKGA